MFSDCTWPDAVVPLAMEFVAPEIDGGEVGIADLDAGFVGVLVERSLHAQALVGSDAADQVDHHLSAQQRSASPVVGDVAEHPMLDLVPFAGAWRKMAHVDNQTSFIGELLQFHFP